MVNRNITYEALLRYFNRLTKTGYVPYNEVESLIILMYIKSLSKESIISGSDIIINRALDCLYGSNCLLGFQGCNEDCI